MANILLVEDHVDSATLLALGLEYHGHTITVAHNVASALRLALDSDFDILLTDLSLPDGSGYSLLHALRKKERDFFAIAMSGYGSEKDILKSKAAGFVSHLIKPVTSDQIDHVVKQTLS